MEKLFFNAHALINYTVYMYIRLEEVNYDIEQDRHGWTMLQV